MKITKKQQQFLIDAVDNTDVCQQWKTKVKDAFPKLFVKEGLEVGKWYKLASNEIKNDPNYKSVLVCFKDYGGVNYGFGRSCSDWTNHYNIHKNKNYTPATDKEVETTLINYLDKQLGY